MSLPSIKRLETEPGLVTAQERTTAAIKNALQDAGVDFLDTAQVANNFGVAFQEIDYESTGLQPYGDWRPVDNQSGAILALRKLWKYGPQGNGIDSVWAACDQKQLVRIGEAILDPENGEWKLRTKKIVFKKPAR